jgi:choline dehydrogenase-like flavoprotein
MLCDWSRLQEWTFPTNATVVVGSGAAGLPLALDLARRGQPVVLLESGGDSKDASDLHDAADLNRGVAVGLPIKIERRARVLGGTTQLWRGQCMRLHDIDLAVRPWVPHSGWPLTLRDLAEYYARAERWIGVCGSEYGEALWAGHARLHPIEWNEHHLLHDFTQYAPRPQLAGQYRKELSRSRLVWTVLNATVSRVVLRERAACGVEVAGRDGVGTFVPARKVVLAAGSIENARLLMLSDPEGVGLGLGRHHTGRFLQDHPVVRTAEIHPFDYTFFQDRYVILRRGRQRLFPKVRLAPEAQEKYELMDANAVFLHDHDDPGFAAATRLVNAARTRQWRDIQGADAAWTARHPVPLLRDAYRRFGRGLATATRPAHVWLQLWLEQQPDEDSRVTLDESRDTLGLRRARLDWRCSEQEMRTSRRLTRWIAEDLVRMRLAEVTELPAMQSDDAWLESVRDAAHPAGTTRMSAHPDHGVVDKNLQVHGVPGLFVVGGSVFPTAGYANPVLTIVALALRLAEHLAPGTGTGDPALKRPSGVFRRAVSNALLDSERPFTGIPRAIGRWGASRLPG